MDGEDEVQALEKTFSSPAEKEAYYKTIKTKLLQIQKELMSGTLKSKARNDSLLELIEVSKSLKNIEDFVPITDLLKCIRLVCVDKEKIVRATALRALRKILSTPRAVQAFLDAKIDILVSRTLERDPKYAWERMQAHRLCKGIMEVAPQLFPRSLVMSLVAIADCAQDEFRKVCLDTLRELVLLNTDIVASCNAVKYLVDAILHPDCQDMYKSLTLTILYLLDQEATRKSLRPSLDLQKLWSVFTDTDAPDGPEKEGRKKTASEALVMMMRSWTGILSLASDEYGLKSLIKTMALPEKVKGSAWARDAVSDLLFEILEVVKSPGTSFLNNRGTTRTNLLNNYVVMVLIAFVNCGMVEVLTEIGIDGSREAASTATSLLSAILNLAADLLPPSLNARLNSLASVVSLAAKFDGETAKRIRASNMLSELGEYSDYTSISENSLPVQKVRTKGHSSSSPTESRGSLTIETLATETDINSNYKRYRRFTKHKRKEQMIKTMRVQVESQVDEVELCNLLRSSQVVVHKEYRKWNFAICLELLEGPLQNPQHLSYVLTKTKFCKRLLSFLNPKKQLFSIIPWTAENIKYAYVASQLFRTLAGSEEGCQYIFFLDLIDEIVRSIIQKVTGKTFATEPGAAADIGFLNLESIQSTLSREYFTLIGILTESNSGLTLLSRRNLLDEIFPICQNPKLDYITRLFVLSLDFGFYSSEGSKARVLIPYWLVKGSLALRHFLINHIRLILRANIEGFLDWGMELLVGQLMENEELAVHALRVLEEVCDDHNSIQILIHKNPSFSVVKEKANTLLLRFLELPLGYDYLNALKWIQPQMTWWRTVGCNQYVENLEAALVGALNDNANTPGFSYATRSLEEDYTFDRVHSFPWRVQVTLQNDDGSEFPLSCDTYIDSIPGVDGHVDLRIVGIADFRAQTSFNRILPSTTLIANLSIGREDNLTPSHSGPDPWKKRCEPKHRGGITMQNPTISIDSVTWIFSIDDQTLDEDEEEGILLHMVSIPLPSFATPVTTVSLAPHFYGQLVKTQEGCQALLTSGDFDTFVRRVQDPDTNWMDMRAALWTIGQIGSSPLGFNMLAQTNVVQFISEQAMRCSTLSMRGTCFYILGLLALTESGRFYLDQLGWDFPINTDLAIAVPKDITTFLKIPVSTYKGSWAMNPGNMYGITEVPSTSAKLRPKVTDVNYSKVILGYISNLSNEVVKEACYGTLLRFRQKCPQYFLNLKMMIEACKLMTTYYFDLQSRRFIWFDLFDQVPLTEKTLRLFDTISSKSEENIPLES